jgi:hypothetical protein
MARCKPCHRGALARFECTQCSGPVSHKGVKLCQACRSLSLRGAGSRWYQGGRSIKDGYVYLSGQQDHPNAVSGKIAEHVLIMSEIIGRPLLPHETVHHKNGIRDDNRPSNLELWSRSQPAGQRVADKLEWAREFIAIYHPEWLA